jgi:hypothetical protein
MTTFWNVYKKDFFRANTLFTIEWFHTHCWDWGGGGRAAGVLALYPPARQCQRDFQPQKKSPRSLGFHIVSRYGILLTLSNSNTHRWASTSIFMLAISDIDIDICYSGIGDKYVGLKTAQRNRTRGLRMRSEYYKSKLLCLSIKIGMSDNGYRIKLYSDIRYNAGLCSISPISEVPISGSVQYCLSRISDLVPTYGKT